MYVIQAYLHSPIIKETLILKLLNIWILKFLHFRNNIGTSLSSNLIYLSLCMDPWTKRLWCTGIWQCSQTVLSIYFLVGMDVNPHGNRMVLHSWFMHDNLRLTSKVSNEQFLFTFWIEVCLSLTIMGQRKCYLLKCRWVCMCTHIFIHTRIYTNINIYVWSYHSY